MAGKKGKKRIYLIFDPESGEEHEPTQRIQQVTKLLQDQGFKVKLALAKPKEVATRLARKAARKGYRTVVAMGGDGTIESVARELVDTKTRLGIIPNGTENNLAKCLGIPLDAEGAVKLLKEGKGRKIDVGQVKVKGHPKMYFLEVVGTGILASLFPAGKDIDRGRWGQLGKLLEQAIDFPTSQVKVTLDGESHVEVPSLMVTVSNSPAFGKGFRLAPDASMVDGLLDVNLYAHLSKAALAAYFAETSGGRLADNKNIERYRAKKIVIKADPPQDAMADGIMLGRGKVKIRVRKHALRMVLGKHMGLAQETTQAEEKLPEPAAPTPERTITKAPV